MNRYEQAVAYHHKGFNCCQSVLAAYSDLTGLSQQASFDMGGGFGAGAQTGELCGAITGAILTLGMLTPVDPQDPATCSSSPPWRSWRRCEGRMLKPREGLPCLLSICMFTRNTAC